jgi:hypothetical protein
MLRSLYEGWMTVDDGPDNLLPDPGISSRFEQALSAGAEVCRRSEIKLLPGLRSLDQRTPRVLLCNGAAMIETPILFLIGFMLLCVVVWWFW